MTKLRQISFVCGLLFLSSISIHAQYIKLFNKGGYWHGINTQLVDSVTITKDVDGKYYHGFYGHDIDSEELPPFSYWYPIEEIDSLRFFDLDTMHSIMAELRERGNFTYFLRLVSDVDDVEGWWNEWGYSYTLSNELAGMNDRTVFVAADSAWASFFAANAKLPVQNPWHNATSYDKLSLAQKKLLVKTCISSKSVSKEIHNTLRSFNSIETTDSITYVASQDLPFSYNPGEKDYWARFREDNGGRGIYLAIDSTQPMKIHFSEEFMRKNTILDSDYNIITGKGRHMGDVHIFDALVKLKDIACDNGYVNVIEKPLCPRTNMAEAIRTNGKTNIFSHILDRFSAPFYCDNITWEYKIRNPEFTDSIFTKRYFSRNNYSVKAGYVKPDENGRIPLFEPGPGGRYRTYNPYLEYVLDEYKGLTPSLKFDPGWNGYSDESDPKQDMAAIFVPSDNEMWRYFTQGGGTDLVLTFAFNEGIEGKEIPYVAPETVEDLYKQIDCIPLSVMEKIINNMMQSSFVNSVPSKWSKLTDDAMEPLFPEVDWAIATIDTCLVCSNGVVYVMDRSFVPADFRAVTAPAVISKTNKIINAALYGDFMDMNYSAYLKNMRTRFTFLLPSDKGLAFYYDPASMKSRTPRVIKFRFVGGNTPVTATANNYNCQYSNKTPLGEIGYQIAGANGKIDATEVTNRLKDILESHTIVMDGTNPMTKTDEVGQTYWEIPSTTPLDEYYLSKNGNAVKVIRNENDDIIAFKGGFQLENERQGIEQLYLEQKGLLACNVENTREMANGNTYILDSPLVPTYRSVYSIFTNDADMTSIEGTGGETPYSAFYDLCTADGFETEIIGCGLVDGKLTKTQRESALKKFKIFVADNGLDFNVQFFNNYRYTIFVPTNNAVKQAIADGLPTWEEIYEDYHSHCKPYLDENGNPRIDPNGDIEYTDELVSYEDSMRIQAKITYLTNFVRYHFADNSIFADKTALEPTEMVTASYDGEQEQFRKLHVDRVANGNNTILRVCDDVTWQKNGNSMVGSTAPFVTINEKDGTNVRNILARDISCSSTPKNVSMNKITISSSSAAVIHSIDGYLNHTEVVDGRHDKTWETTIKAKRYLQRYAIR